MGTTAASHVHHQRLPSAFLKFMLNTMITTDLKLQRPLFVNFRFAELRDLARAGAKYWTLMLFSS